MGGTQSVAIPGGGTEGYHVLRVSLGVVTMWGLTHFGARMWSVPIRRNPNPNPNP